MCDQLQLKHLFSPIPARRFRKKHVRIFPQLSQFLLRILSPEDARKSPFASAESVRYCAVSNSDMPQILAASEARKSNFSSGFVSASVIKLVVPLPMPPYEVFARFWYNEKYVSAKRSVPLPWRIFSKRGIWRIASFFLKPF